MAKLAYADDDDAAVTIHQLDEVLADVLGWLCVKEIMCSRRVCKKWTEAVKKTIVPPSRFWVNSVTIYNAMGVITRAMPNLQQLVLFGFEYGHKWSDGEDQDVEQAAYTAHCISHDIGIISNFSKLRDLEISSAGLNGRYPFLFNSFPLLRKLSIDCESYLKWDLEMLAGFPLLKELEFCVNCRLTGNINSLRVLKNTLENVRIVSCSRVAGNFMDLADFPHLKVLHLVDTAVTGDIRDIGDNDFPSLEKLYLPKGVYGGFGYQLQRISEAPEVARVVYLLRKQRPKQFNLLLTNSIEKWYGQLSKDSPDWYESVEEDDFHPPFYIHFVQAGSRIGYRWQTCYDGRNPCEANWLDPEPDRESNDYRQYIEELQQIESQVKLYRGYQQPPTEEEYRRLCEER